MPLIYATNVLSLLSSNGYTTTKLRREKLLSEGTIQALREYHPISMKSLETICDLLSCSPNDIIARVNGRTKYLVYRNDIYKHSFVMMESLCGTYPFNYTTKTKLYDTLEHPLQVRLDILTDEDHLVLTTYDMYGAKYQMNKIAKEMKKKS